MCDVRTLDGEDPGHVTEDATRATSAHAFVDELLLALSNSRVYSPDHPRVVASLEALSGSLERLLEDLETDTFLLGAADGYLFYDKRPLLAASRSAPRLLVLFDSLSAGGLAIRRGARPHEFLALARVLGQKDVDSLDALTANLCLEREGAASVRFLPRYTEGEGGGGPGGPGACQAAGAAGAAMAALDVPTLEVSAHLYRGVFDHLTDVVTSVFRGHLFRLDDTKKHVEHILKDLADNTGSMLNAAHYEQTDADQFQFRHAIRVSCLALSFAKGLTHSERFLERIGAAALLHDVGKGRLDDWTILHKPGRLTEAERLEMERHTELGAQLLLEVEDPDPLAVAIAFGHHRSLTGGGYPRTAIGTQLSMATRLVKICDVYEALTARRPYKEPMSPARAYRIMLDMNRQQEGTHFEPKLLHRFILVNGIYPDGSWVRLNTDEVACIVRQTGDIEKPIVSVEKAAGQIRGERALFTVPPRRIDLRQEGDRGVPRHIVRWVGYSEPKAA